MPTTEKYGREECGAKYYKEKRRGEKRRYTREEDRKRAMNNHARHVGIQSDELQ